MSAKDDWGDLPDELLKLIDAFKRGGDDVIEEDAEPSPPEDLKK